MKQSTLQWKYNFLQIFYWICTCCLTGFAAIFLNAKGFSNSLIGIATGGAAILTVFLGPALSSITSRFHQISLQVFLTIQALTAAAFYAMAAFLPLPAAGTLVIYMMGMGLSTSIMPILSQVSMAYISKGQPVNFGLGRGLGSVAFALGALVLTQISGCFSPLYISLVYAASAFCFALLLKSMEPVYAPAPAGKGETISRPISQEDQMNQTGQDVQIRHSRKESGKTTLKMANPDSCSQKQPHSTEADPASEPGGSSPVRIIAEYPRFFGVLAGFCLIFTCVTALNTYLITLVRALGGNETMYGIALFGMAASELPVMAIASRLMKRFGSVPLILAAAFFYLIRNVGMVLANSLPVLILCLMFQGLSYGLLTAVTTYFVNKNLRNRDHVMGQTMVIMMTNGLGSTMGNFGGGLILDLFGLPTLFLWVIILTLCGSAVMMISALLVHKRAVRVNALDPQHRFDK